MHELLSNADCKRYRRHFLNCSTLRICVLPMLTCQPSSSGYLSCIVQHEACKNIDTDHGSYHGIGRGGSNFCPSKDRFDKKGTYVDLMIEFVSWALWFLSVTERTDRIVSNASPLIIRHSECRRQSLAKGSEQFVPVGLIRCDALRLCIDQQMHQFQAERSSTW
jgi:hypothetical protein